VPEEVLIPFETTPRPHASAIRSTLICSSLQALRALMELFWKKAYVRLITAKRTSSAFEIRASWA
jgi:hypothetical protein